MADDDFNETEHNIGCGGCAPRGPCAVQSVCSTYARKLTSFYLPPSRLLARRRPAREHTRIPVIGVMQTKYARPDFFRTTALKFQLD